MTPAAVTSTSPATDHAPSAAPASTFGERCAALAGDIKLSHSIFAMPWAILATFLAAPAGRPRLGQIALIVVCMVFARTSAMAANRLLDARLDRLNPRTARRAIPAGRLTAGFVAFATVACGIAFVGAASLFGVIYGNWIPLAASVPVLAFICGYPLLKRFTRLCHYYLGAALALAPVCAWVAMAGGIDVEPLLMAGAVLLWTAGFDIIYACQDYESDLQTGVVSVPVKVGIRNALWIARLTHVACIALLIALGIVSAPLGTLFFVGVGLTVVLMTIEHLIVKPHDLSKVNLAFFTINGIIALVVGVLGIIDTLWL